MTASPAPRHRKGLRHVAGTTEIDGFPCHSIPPLREVVALYELASLPARRARVAAIGVNTRFIADDEEARRAVAAIEAETGLVADDPVRFGSARLVDAVLAARAGLAP